MEKQSSGGSDAAESVAASCEDFGEQNYLRSGSEILIYLLDEHEASDLSCETSRGDFERNVGAPFTPVQACENLAAEVAEVPFADAPKVVSRIVLLDLHE